MKHLERLQLVRLLGTANRLASAVLEDRGPACADALAREVARIASELADTLAAHAAESVTLDDGAPATGVRGMHAGTGGDDGAVRSADGVVSVGDGAVGAGDGAVGAGDDRRVSAGAGHGGQCAERRGWTGWIDRTRGAQVASRLPCERTSRVRVGHEAIDLDSRTGRWELVALAVLYSAPIRAPLAEDAFVFLRREGLLDFATLSQNESVLRQHLVSALRERYPARARKEDKAEALIANARLIAWQWEGDLERVYELAGGEGPRVWEALGQLRHVRKRIPWICREMRRAGRWPLGGRYATYVDAGVRLAVSKLRLTRPDGVTPRDLTDEECVAVAEQLFDGDTAALSALGSQLCSQECAEACARCPLRGVCPTGKHRSA